MANKLTSAQVAEIHRMRDEGKPVYAIVRKTGITNRTVERHYFNMEFNAWCRDFDERWDRMRALFGINIRRWPRNKDEEFALRWEEMRRLYGKA